MYDRVSNALNEVHSTRPGVEVPLYFLGRHDHKPKDKIGSVSQLTIVHLEPEKPANIKFNAQRLVFIKKLQNWTLEYGLER